MITAGPWRSPSEATDAWLEAVLLQGGHNTNVVLLATSLLGLAAGIVGCFAMLKKQSLVADAFAHAALVGVSAAFLIHGAAGATERSVPVLLLGAALSGGLAVAAIEWLTRRTRLPADTATAAVSSASFGAGIVMLSIARRTSSADQAGLDGLIFGAAASMTGNDAWLMATIAALVLALTALLAKPLTAVAFNERFARTSGLPVGAVDAGLAALVATVTLAGLQAVGMLLVVALLVTPPATARLWVKSVVPLIALAGGVGAVSGWIGVSLSAVLPRAPTGSLVVLVAATCFGVSLVVAPRRGLLRGIKAARALGVSARREAATSVRGSEDIDG